MSIKIINYVQNKGDISKKSVSDCFKCKTYIIVTLSEFQHFRQGKCNLEEKGSTENIVQKGLICTETVKKENQD